MQEPVQKQQKFSTTGVAWESNDLAEF